MAYNKKFIKGLFKDTGKIDQPEGSWRHAKNTIFKDKQGSITNEGGTDLAHYLFNTFPGQTTSGNQHERVIGKIELEDNRTILFVTEIKLNNNGVKSSEIGIFQDDKYTTVFRPDIIARPETNLNFNINNPIEGTYKIDSKGDLILYWTDDLNPPRAFNFDRQLRESVIFIGNVNYPNWKKLYGLLPIQVNNIDILNLFPYSGPVPHISLITSTNVNGELTQQSVVEGGTLLTGVYYLALAYVDEDEVATNYLTVSNPLSITDEFDHTRPTTKKDGAKHGNQTSKSCVWNVTNLNNDYKYMRPVVIRKMGDATEAFRLNDVEIPVTATSRVIFSGTEGSSAASVDDVIIDTVSYDTAKTIQQLDNVLYLGNLTGKSDLGYQKYANNIKSRSVIKTIDPFDETWLTADFLQNNFANSVVDNGNTVEESKSYRFVPNNTDYRGYMRDEVYAFYISFIMKDGSMSYAYHIPGRLPMGNSTVDPISYVTDYSGYEISPANGRSEINGIPGTTWASTRLKELSAYARLYHFYDLSPDPNGPNIAAATATAPNPPINGSRHMNFWHNVNEVYPATNNFEVWNRFGKLTGTTSISGVILQNGDISGQRVRHHRMPSNDNKARSSVARVGTKASTVDPDMNYDIEPTDPSIPIISIAPSTYVGTFRVTEDHNTTDSNDSYPTLPSDHWVGQVYSDALSTCPGHSFGNKLYNDTPAPGTGVPATNVYDTGARMLIAQEDNTQVTVRHSVQWYNDANTYSRTAYCLSRHLDVTGTTTIQSDETTKQISPCHQVCGGSCPGNHNNHKTQGTFVYVLMQGERIRIEGKGNANSPPCTDRQLMMLPNGKQLNYSSCQSSYTISSYVEFTVEVGPQFGPNPPVYHDVNVHQDARILGMQFDDIQIPQSYADKIQGFRIYRAKRDYSDRTVLGQGQIIPTEQKIGIVGLCKELTGTTWNSQTVSAYAQQANATEYDEVRLFYACDAFSRPPSEYTTAPLNNNPENNQGNAYKNIQFYDFGMLKDKHTLAPATHIRLQYVTNDLTWNGPDISQPKKMLTAIKEVSGVLNVSQFWGYMGENSASGADIANCYPRAIPGAMFAGATYVSAKEWSGSAYGITRTLGQKSKTYLRGDSIFAGEPLGFGGDIVNLGGHSSILLGLADKVELPALFRRKNSSPLGPTDFGYNWPGTGFHLASPTKGTVDGLSTGSITIDPWHQTYITNLGAFKTDVYKSIDSQELVWTGFEVLEDDLEVFLFEDLNGAPVADPAIAFATDTLAPEGIFGGDTFLARYGVSTAYSPLDDQTESNPQRAIHTHIVESTYNIALRHTEDSKSIYFPGTTALRIFKDSGPEKDLNESDNLKYNINYHADNNIRPAFPLPLKDIDQTDFPTRTHRSAKGDPTSLIDNWRIFKANQYKDLPKNRGDLWKLSSFNNLLYFHMEESLFAAQGKQTMSMKDGSEAFVGSGDIFAQEPNELIHTKNGFGGTQSQWAALTTRHGYFFIDAKSKKVFLMKDKLEEISQIGMEKWFRDNLDFKLVLYGFSSVCSIDNPPLGIGLHATYDPKHKRILLTKKDLEPTADFITGFNEVATVPNCTLGKIIFRRSTCQYYRCNGCKIAGCDPWEPIDWDNEKFFKKIGWTISYYPDLNMWGSFHDYIPYMYFQTSTDFYSLTNIYKFYEYCNAQGQAAGYCPTITTAATHPGTTVGNAGIWKHNSTTKGILHQENFKGTLTNQEYLDVLNYNPFIFEFIHNELKTESHLLSSFEYDIEVFNDLGSNLLQHGFTSYFIYNTLQNSGENEIKYLIDTRFISNKWKINGFRDMAAVVDQTGNLSTGLNLPNTSSYYTQAGTNVLGGANTGTLTTSSIDSMFIFNGMEKDLNINYIDLTKNWDQKRKFIDKWVGIRLIYDNKTNNLLNLYSTQVNTRKAHR